MFKRLIALTPAGFQEEVRRFYFRWKIKKGNFITPEPEFMNLDQLVSKDDWVIDIGANIGQYTIKMSELVGPKGRVISFEPIPVTFGHLASNAVHSKYSNITLINAAVSDQVNVVGMSMPNFASGLKNYYEASISNALQDGDIPVLTLSIDSLELKQRINLIKIDAEGHEPVIFQGIKKLLERDKPTLIVETVDESIRQQLISLGYSEQRHSDSSNTVFLAKGR